MPSKLTNIKGRRYGRWKVLFFVQQINKHYYWRCQCSCDKKTIRDIDSANLRSKKTQSCGCIRKEKAEKQRIRKQRQREKLRFIVVSLWEKGYRSPRQINSLLKTRLRQKNIITLLQEQGYDFPATP